MRHFISIPEEIRKYNRWVCWSMEERDGKPTKIPKNPKTGGNAMANNPDTWGSFKQAVDRMKSDKFAGIGFMFNGDGIIGVDIDDCRDKETGELTEQAKEIIEILDSYTEISASGKGIHIICKGSLPEGKRRRGPVEMYDNLRYFIMTGQVIDNQNIIQDRVEQLASVHEKYINVKKTQRNVSKKTEIVTNLDDDDIIEKAMAAKNGDLFTDLMNGNWKHRYQSQSEADIALSNLLAFWTGKDIEQMNRIFCRSGLYRDKWDEARPGGTYGSMTMENSINNCQDIYIPQKEGKKQNQKKEVSEGVIFDDEESFEQLVKEYESDDSKVKVFSCDDIGNAERLLHNFGLNLHFCPSFGKWLIWVGNRWCTDERGQIWEYARKTAREIITEAYGAEEARRDALLKHARRSCSNQSIKAMVEQAKSMGQIPILPNELDKDPWRLNLINGTMDLKTGKLKENKREDLISKVCPIEYDKTAKAPLWEKFLNRIFDGNQDLIKFIQRAIGYSLTGSTKEEVFFVLYGNGQNGKSKFLEVISALLGDYSTQAPLNTFMAKQNDAVSNDIAMLKGARLVKAIETDEGKRLSEALVKQLTGGDMVTARFLRQEYFQFQPEFKIFIATNHKPQVRGNDEGMWRRIRLIPFSIKIPEEERDNDLIYKLLKELPGIFNWTLKGCLEWQKYGLGMPECVRQATNVYRAESDTIGNFIDECAIKQPGAKISVADLYSRYIKWAAESGEIPRKKIDFNKQLEGLGYIKATGKGNYLFWHGLTISEFKKPKQMEMPLWYMEK